MKRIAFVLSVLMMLLSFTACGSDKTSDVGNASGVGSASEVIGGSEQQEEQEKKYTLLFNDDRSFTSAYAVLEGGEVEQLADDDAFYGAPAISKDKTQIVYLIRENRTQNLYSKKTGNSEVMIAENVDSIVFDRESSGLIAQLEEGICYFSDITKAEYSVIDTAQILRYDGMYKMLYFSSDGKTVAYIAQSETDEDVGTLYRVDLATLEKTMIADGVTYLLDRVAQKSLYYTTAEGLYHWTGGESQLVAADDAYYINADYDEFFCISGDTDTDYYITEDGNAVSLGELPGYNLVLSSDGKRLAAMSSKKLYVYDLSDSGISNEQTIDGDITDVNFLSDGAILVSKGGSDSSFGIWRDGVYTEILQKFMYVNNMGYLDGCIYYVDPDTKQLVKWRDGKSEVLAENLRDAINAKPIYVIGNEVYYIAKEEAEDTSYSLFLLGVDEPIKTIVNPLYIYSK